MNITVRNKKFKIEFVSNYVHKLSRKYKIVLAEIQGVIAENSKLLSRVKSKELTLEEANDIYENNEFMKEHGSMNKAIDALYESKLDIVKQIIEKNPPLKFNLDWWEKNTDPDDIESFISKCINLDIKDMVNSKKK